MLRPCRIHSCFQQALGEIKKENCRCKYRVSLDQAKKLVEEGLASWLIVDYKKGADGQSVPVTSWNLVWGSKQEDEPESVVRSALAMKTPRVQTIERPHIERSTDPLMKVDGKWVYEKGKVPEDATRIEEWGRLQQEVWQNLLAPFIPDPYGNGRPIIVNFKDDRTCVGKDVATSKITLDKKAAVS